MRHNKSRNYKCCILALGLVLCLALSACSRQNCADQSDQSGSGDMTDYTDSKTAAIEALSGRMAEERSVVWVYRDFGMTENHFTQKAKMLGSDESLVTDMDENCTDNPYEGSTCIKCSQTTREGDWGADGFF